MAKEKEKKPRTTPRRSMPVKPELRPVTNSWYAVDEAEYEAVKLFLLAVEAHSDAARDLLERADMWTADVERIVSVRQDQEIEALFETSTTHRNPTIYTPFWTILRDDGSPAAIAVQNAAEDWTRQWNLIDLNENRRRYVEIALRVWRHTAYGQKPLPGTPILTETWQLDPDATHQSMAQVHGDPALPRASVRYPVAFAPPQYPIHYPNVTPQNPEGDPRPCEEWEQPLYANWESVRTAQPVPRSWEGRAWDPLTPWTEFRDRMKAEFVEYLEAYHARVLRDMQQAYRWQETPERNKRTPEHYLWLAAYQCGSMSLNDVFERSRDFALEAQGTYYQKRDPETGCLTGEIDEEKLQNELPNATSGIADGMKVAADIVGIVYRVPKPSGAKPKPKPGRPKRSRGRPRKVE